MNRLERKKVILCTGGLGFIGSHFVDLCLRHGHKVINIDKETYAANTGMKLVCSTGEYAYKKADISKLDDIPHCDVIVNFAAESHVDNSISGNDVFLNSNVLGVHNLLEIIKNKKIKNMMSSWSYKPPLFIQISTDEVFGDILHGFFKEDDRHMPSNPYAATKSMAEQLVVSWGRTYGLPYIITRTTNNYGPRQHVEKLIPNVITKLVTGKKALVHGDGSYIRNWIHVDDNVEALYKIISEGNCNESYHIASPEEFSVKEIVEKVCKFRKLKYDDVVDSSNDRSGCDLRYALDCSKTKALGWAPRHTFDKQLKNLIQYYCDDI